MICAVGVAGFTALTYREPPFRVHLEARDVPDRQLEPTGVREVETGCAAGASRWEWTDRRWRRRNQVVDGGLVRGVGDPENDQRVVPDPDRSEVGLRFHSNPGFFQVALERQRNVARVPGDTIAKPSTDQAATGNQGETGGGNQDNRPDDDRNHDLDEGEPLLGSEALGASWEPSMRSG